MAEISPILQWLNNHPQLAGLFTFLISAAESVAIVGTIVPGSIMMTGIGVLAGTGTIPFWNTLIWAILGAIFGDGISYWMGHYFKDSLPNVWPFRKYPQLLKAGDAFFEKHGSMSVFIGRFVGPVRAIVPLVAGMLGLKPWKFLVANVSSAILWAPAYMLPGIIVGAASTELPPDIALHVILVLLFVGLFIALCAWFIYKLLQLIADQINQLQNEVWFKLRTSRHLSSITKLLHHYDPQKKHGQLTLAIYLLLVGILFLALLIYIKLNGSPNVVINDAIFHFVRGIRTAKLDSVMINITLFGQKEVLAFVFIVMATWFLFVRKYWTAIHVIMLGVLTAGGVFVLKHLFKISRPWGIFASPETYSFPSGHAAIAMSAFMGFAILIANTFPKRLRWPFYAMAALMIFAISVSRMYLGVHWFTDVLAGWLLGIGALIVTIISYQHRYERVSNPLKILIVFLGSLIIATSVYHKYKFEKFKTNYAQINWPVITLNDENWWQTGEMMPAYRVSLFGFPSQIINIEWEGNLSEIKRFLKRQGFTNPPARDLISILHRIANVKSYQYLPLVSPQYLDKKPALILTRKMMDDKLIAIRLWNSNRISKNGIPIWVGTVSYIPTTYGWVYNRSRNQIDSIQLLNFTDIQGSTEWQWKYVFIDVSTSARKKNFHQILLIKNR